MTPRTTKKGPKKDKNTDLKETIRQLEDRLKRALADYDNLKKQTEKEKQEFVKFANQVLVENLTGIWEGLGLVVKQLQQLLISHGLEEISVSVGDQFDPQIMEAVDTEGDGEEVISILSIGYKLRGKVIKPVKVKVGRIKKTKGASS